MISFGQSSHRKNSVDTCHPLCSACSVHSPGACGRHHGGDRMVRPFPEQTPAKWAAGRMNGVMGRAVGGQIGPGSCVLMCLTIAPRFDTVVF